jgi:signal transduction histidine kinase
MPQVRAHRPTLALAVRNLLQNALKFVPPGRQARVRVCAEILPRSVRLRVQDNGIGLPEKDYARVFKPFERLHSQEEFPGTGIGLATVARAAEKMGGSCAVQSVPGEGSSFWITLGT